MTAREEISQRHAARVKKTRSYDLDEVLGRLVDSWAALVAYYAEGLDFDGLTQTPVGSGADSAFVLVPASGKERDAVIRVECQRGADSVWRIVRVDFAPPAPVSQPASHPAD